MKIPDMYIKELVHGIAGEGGTNLVFLIKDKENVSEFKIAEKLQMTVNEVRNIIYRLQDKNLVLFTRKKDKKKGWYIYYWTFDMPKARDLLISMKSQRKADFQNVLKKETQGNVYVCPNKCLVRMSSEEALEHNFRCHECDAVLVEENLAKRTEKIKKELEKLQLEIDELSKIQKPLPKIEPEKKQKRKIKPRQIPHREHEKKGQHQRIFHPKKKPIHIPPRPPVHIPIKPKRKSFFSVLKKKLRRK